MEGTHWDIFPWESTLQALKREYEEQRHPWLLSRALRQCSKENIPPENWIIEAYEAGINLDPEKRPGRGLRSAEERAIQSTIDWMRGFTISLLRSHGVPVREVFQAASDQLMNEPDVAGSEDAMRQSWQRVKHRFPYDYRRKW